MEVDRKKDYFQFNKGLNTESNELNFPDGFTTDERNYELLLDGSRRRRKALDTESGGADLTVPTVTTTQRYKAYRWRNVGGDPTENQIVLQVGNRLYFMDDVETPSATWKTEYLDLTVLAAPSATSTLIANNPVNFSSHRGYLLIAGEYIEPAYVEYQPGTDDYAAVPFTLRMRDFEGIDDGVPIDKQLTGTITAAHYYNLLNRGWKDADITDYKTNSSGTTNPAKNMIWWKGYRRANVTGKAEADGTHEWSTVKMEAERVGGGDAPQGSILLEVFNTNNAEVSAGVAQIPITAWTEAGSGTWTITITATGHGLANPTDSVQIIGQNSRYDDDHAAYDWNFNGTHTTTYIDANNFSISVTEPAGFSAWQNQYLAYGYILSSSLTNPDGAAYDERPTVVESHDGHIFWAGIPNSQYADHVFFGQLGLKPVAWDRCYQQADPTDPDINELGPADGGVIVIPGLGKVVDALSTRQGLVLFSDQGIWEIGNGRRGVFTADGYAVRKISSAEATSPYGCKEIDGTLMFTGPKGIFTIAPNQYTGLLEATNISDGLIRTKWNAIAAVDQKNIQIEYDDAKKRVYILYDDGSCTNANQYNAAICIDMTVGAFFVYAFNTGATFGIVGMIAVTDADSSASNQKMKFFTPATSTALRTCDFNQTDYTDFDGSEMPSAYIYSGWDNLGDHQRKRQAPVIVVYQGRTETGFTVTGNGYDPVNESSTTMYAFWDWVSDATNEADTNKKTAGQQIYRHLRVFVPSATTDLDGYPIVVTRNKVRGRGRALQLKFTAGTNKDSHILGFTYNYKITRRK